MIYCLKQADFGPTCSSAILFGQDLCCDCSGEQLQWPPPQATPTSRNTYHRATKARIEGAYMHSEGWYCYSEHRPLVAGSYFEARIAFRTSRSNPRALMIMVHTRVP